MQRSDLCHCGSGNKYKRCCLSSDNSFSQREETISPALIKKSVNRLKNRVHNKLGKDFILHDGSSKIKMSEVILDLGHEILELAKTTSECKKVIDITCIAWNLSVLSSVEKEELLTNFLNKIHEKAREDTFELLSTLIDKKNPDYPHINRVIVDYEVLDDKGNIHLNVMSIVPESELAELN